MNDMGVDHVHHPVVHPDSLTPPRQPRFGTDFDDLMINSQMSHKRETSDTNKPRASPHDQRQQSNGEHQRIHLAIGARRAYARKRHDNIPNEIIEHKLLKETISVAIVLDDGSKGKGGIQKYAFYLIDQIKKSDQNIIITEQKSRILLPGILNNASAILCLLNYIIIIILKRIDIIHINIAPRGATLRKLPYILLSKISGTKILLHLHGGGYEDFFDYSWHVIKKMIKWAFQSADKVIILEEGSRAFVTCKAGVLPDKVVAIGNGVPPAKEPAFPCHKVPKICFMGRLVPLKGVDILLSALSFLAQRGLAFEATIGGNGDANAFRRIADEYGIGAQVNFTGWLSGEQVAHTYSESDVFVLPSLIENQPMSILEAMAHRLPVIASNVGAIATQVLDDETGLLVPPGDAAALADALERLCRDPELRRKMGDAGFTRWRDRYSIATVTKQVVALYREIAA